MNAWTREARINQLKAMHGLMMESNDEDLYLTWVTGGVPDCPIEDDYMDIAEDEGLYSHCCDLFTSLVQNKGWRW